MRRRACLGCPRSRSARPTNSGREPAATALRGVSPSPADGGTSRAAPADCAPCHVSERSRFTSRIHPARRRQIVAATATPRTSKKRLVRNAVSDGAADAPRSAARSSPGAPVMKRCTHRAPRGSTSIMLRVRGRIPCRRDPCARGGHSRDAGHNLPGGGGASRRHRRIGGA